MFIKKIILLSSISVLTGCIGGNRVEDVESKMQAIRQSPAQEVSQPPVFETVQSFNYAAEKLRSPFMPPSLSRRLQEEAITGSQVVPDDDRPSEHLEEFDLAQLVMRGIFQEPSGDRYALIEDPTGTVFPARVGNYMGKSHGRIVEINAREVNLIEIVPDGARGFVERPKTILAPGS